MDVSVILLTRNTCQQTREAIESVLSSAGTITKEIRVIDNASTDETFRRLPAAFPDVRYTRMERNLGFARGVNLAAREARGDFLLLLNSDARLAQESLGLAVEWMRANPGCGVAGAQLFYADGRKQNSIANFPSLATELLNKFLLRTLWPQRFPGKEQEYREPVAVESVIGAFFLVRREVWEKLGGMDERFFFFLEETDFCLRARQAGFATMHLPQVRVWHGQGQTAKQDLASARIEYWRSRYAYFAKHRGLAVRAVLRCGLLLRLIVDSAVSGWMTAFTFGQSRRWREKFAVHRALLFWHLRGCPSGAGLPR
ncbi:MAG TPA: glycosyltransferase family 2 protein [Candidatus Acidoferrales bacterium]|nr:glycosyltransferase family 2 protein [Candidatus Acidoferrales bacterium]